MGFDVGVTRTLMNFVTKLLATDTPHIAQLILSLLVCQKLIIIKDLIGLFVIGVLLELAPGLVLPSFAATPPHLTTPVGVVHTA